MERTIQENPNSNRPKRWSTISKEYQKCNIGIVFLGEFKFAQSDIIREETCHTFYWSEEISRRETDEIMAKIFLLFIAGKMFTRIQLNRLLTLSEDVLPKASCGLRANQGIMYMFFSLWQIQEKCIERIRPSTDYHYFFLLLWEFFTPAVAGDFPLEFEWQQVSSSLQNSSQYSGRSW